MAGAVGDADDPLAGGEPPGVGLGDAEEFRDAVGLGVELNVGVGLGEAVVLGDGVGLGEGDGLDFGVAADDAVPLDAGGTAGVGSGLPTPRTAATMIAIATAMRPITNARRTQ